MSKLDITQLAQRFNCATDDPIFAILEAIDTRDLALKSEILTIRAEMKRNTSFFRGFLIVLGVLFGVFLSVKILIPPTDHALRKAGVFIEMTSSQLTISFSKSPKSVLRSEKEIRVELTK